MSDFSQDRAWHALKKEEVCSLLNTSTTGLNKQEAQKRLEEVGHNIFRKYKQESIFRIFFRQVRNPLIYVLLAATILAIVMGKVTDGMVILAVVVINSIIGFIQEYQAGKAIQDLMKMIPEYATVVRDGEQTSIPAQELVPGDYVLLQPGDSISADIRLTFVKNLQCNEAALTGESVPVYKTTDPVEENAISGDRKNIGFSGTLVTAGTGAGVVVATGVKTEIGKISELLQTTQSLKTPLTRSLEKIARDIAIAILFVGIAVFVIGMFREYTFIDSMLSAITLAVAAIPEGLPAIITITSAIGVQRMAGKKAIIRHLTAVETLGSTTVICSDKTGTLTKNEMTVQAMWTGKVFYEVTGTGIAPEGEIVKAQGQNGQPSDYISLLRAGMLCNDASLEQEEGEWKGVGDPTETALVTSARKAGMTEKQLRNEWKRIDEIPFDSERKIMATLHLSPEGKKVLMIKGAPEVVTPLINDRTDKNSIYKAAGNYANEGKRVLAFAEKILPEGKNNIEETDLESGFTFLGLQAMIDPPRIEVKEAIKTCHNAGINVKMITGDHPGTAAAIGRELGILNGNNKVITGRELQEMDDETLQEEVVHTNVFARVAPEHKLRLVKLLQHNNQVVAMTGDGVNDSPALKRADIGVAMGITGTAVAKDASDMILTDDNFESIEAAVEEGRRVYDNLLKSIAFVLPTSLAQALVILIAVVFFPIINGMLLRPMQPVQVLWVNLITAVALALPLSMEAMEPDVMDRPPREPGAAILNKLIIFRTLLVGLIMAGGAVGLFLWEYDLEMAAGVEADIALAEGQTMAVTALVFFQVFYLINCRSLNYSVFKIGLFSNLWVYLGILVVLLSQAAFIYFPTMNFLFHSAPLNPEALLMSFAVGFTILPIIGVEKWIRRKVIKN
ncbi:MAG: cation-translocating P-type ATPase [Cytophagaceae bacterium]